jgi:hypothetical protein
MIKLSYVLFASALAIGVSQAEAANPVLGLKIEGANAKRLFEHLTRAEISSEGGGGEGTIYRSGSGISCEHSFDSHVANGDHYECEIRVSEQGEVVPFEAIEPEDVVSW